MASVHPLSESSHHGSSVPVQRSTDEPDTDVLREENRQLRELVIHLSKLVIRDVVTRK